ncbi:chromoplast-specific carotenoid-associated protein C1, chromoplastic [Dendrobium catenatum]|uniref:Plastid-lipid-associated protein, chloroplastic n=1 Tax=Dendrobium catenatum TaxID=906689 RepID=A0A2I0VIN9_9ASPA|nr:chromoplast-specific carotenoid-associated protein C1, chromoplastic [Dendrobium catenatum]PKU63278.1 Plastid-lipid-associated protein, chloroplastic [Dendrobium catenatum]
MSSLALRNAFALNAFPAALSAAPVPAGRNPPPLALLSSRGLSPVSKRRILTIFRPPTAPSFRLQAVADDDEWGAEKKILKGAAGSVAAVEEETTDVTSVTAELKRKLLDQLFGTDRGLKATSETRAEVNELITQLEAKNPTPAPTEALSLLNGKWILAYTSFVGLFPLLGAGSLPQLVKVDEISQTIDSEAFTVQNSVRFVGPFSSTSVSTNAKFEVRSPKRVQIKFEEGIIGTPQLTDSIVIPDKFEFFGQSIDLSPFNGVISSLQDTASSVAKTISSQPPLKFPISNSNAQSWLLTTYLDDELRISRGDGSSVFVLIKEGSALLS